MLGIGFEGALWQVPITIATAQSQQAYKFVLNKQSMTVTLDNVNPQDWIKVSILHFMEYKLS